MKEIQRRDRKKGVNTKMGYYLAFPAHRLEELLALLPPDERTIYADYFSEIVGNLVWVKEDAENALLQALEECEHPDAPQWKTDTTLQQQMVAELMDVDNDALTQLVQDGLLTLAH